MHKVVIPEHTPTPGVYLGHAGTCEVVTIPKKEVRRTTMSIPNSVKVLESLHLEWRDRVIVAPRNSDVERARENVRRVFNSCILHKLGYVLPSHKTPLV